MKNFKKKHLIILTIGTSSIIASAVLPFVFSSNNKPTIYSTPLPSIEKETIGIEGPTAKPLGENEIKVPEKFVEEVFKPSVNTGAETKRQRAHRLMSERIEREEGLDFSDASTLKNFLKTITDYIDRSEISPEIIEDVKIILSKTEYLSLKNTL